MVLPQDEPRTRRRHALRELASSVATSPATYVLVALLAYSTAWMWPTLFKAWFYRSDEYVYIAEVIRFAEGDFRQQLFEIPGTPLISLATLTMLGIHSVERLAAVVSSAPSPPPLETFVWQNITLCVLTLRILTFAAYLATIPLTYFLAKRATNWQGGCVAAIVTALNPAYTSFSIFVRTEALANCFVLGALLVLWRPPPRTRHPALIALTSGLLAGFGMAARYHSMMVSLPLLTAFLLWVVEPRAVRSLNRRERGLVFAVPALAVLCAVVLTVAIAQAVVVDGAATTPEWPFATRFLQKVAAGAMLSSLLLAALLLAKPTRSLVRRVLDPRLGCLLGGFVAGFFLASPTILWESEFFLRRMNFYLGDYVDTGRAALPLTEKIATYVWGYVQVIAPGRLSTALLLAGCGLVLLIRSRPMLIMLAVGVSFFFSKPIDLIAAPHHITLWLPLFATIMAYPVSMLAALCSRSSFVREHVVWANAGWMLALAILARSMVDGPALAYAEYEPISERLAAVADASEWVERNTEQGAQVFVTYSCFNEGAAYAWIRLSGLSVPKELWTREWHVWWGYRSDAAGMSGYVCASERDISLIHDIANRNKPGEGTNPYDEPTFRRLASFGEGEAKVDVFAFDWRR